MNQKFCVFLDAGHGDINPTTGTYDTPGKRHYHPNYTFHNEGWFYEGVWNREVVKRVAMKLQWLQVPYMIVNHEYLDTPLEKRVEIANWYHQEYFDYSIYLSSHANASPQHNARGWEVYTYPGYTLSDDLAEMTYDETRNQFGGILRYRTDTSDNDADKEERFYVLKHTIMPAILIEHGYFDHLDDALILQDQNYLNRYAEAQVRAALKFYKCL